MRIPEKYQELYFFLQEMENKLHNLDKKNDLRKGHDKELDITDKEGISLVHDVRRMLEDLKEFGPYNDMENIWGVSIEEIKDSVNERFVNLERLVNELEKGENNDKRRIY